jgi:hypothetical protein
MDTVSLMGGGSDDDDGGGMLVAERRPLWTMMAVPKFLRRFRKERRRGGASSSSINKKDRHHKNGGANGDQTTVAPSHSTSMSRLDESFDTFRDSHHSSKRLVLRRPRTTNNDNRFLCREEEIVFEEEASSFAQQSLNTGSYAPSAFYVSHPDGMEVILKNGVLSDATEYSWSPTPEDYDGCNDVELLEPIKNTLPVEEICFFPDDDHYSSLIDGDHQGENMFAILGLESVNEGLGSSSSTEEEHRQQLQSSFQTLTSTSTKSTEHSKPTAAMIKRLSAFSGEDLLRQEADLFAQLLRLDDERSKGTTKSSINNRSHPQKVLRSSESRLLAAIDAISDDDDTLSKDHSFLVYHQSLMDNNTDADDDDDDDEEEETTISTVTGSNIYPTRRLEPVTAIVPRVNNTNNYCGLFVSEPIQTDADDYDDDDDDADDDDDDDDDYSDLYSRPSTNESSSWRY